MVHEKKNPKSVDETHYAQSDVFTTYLPIVGYSYATLVKKASGFVTAGRKV